MELSKSPWLLTSLSPGAGERMSKHTVRAGDVAGLLERFAQLRAKAKKRGGQDYDLIVIQEAGLDGFWVHRVLEQEGMESHVVDPASIGGRPIRDGGGAGTACAPRTARSAKSTGLAVEAVDASRQSRSAAARRLGATPREARRTAHFPLERLAHGRRATRQKPATRQGEELNPGAFARESKGDVHHRQARADQDRRAVVRRGGDGPPPRVGDIEGRCERQADNPGRGWGAGLPIASTTASATKLRPIAISTRHSRALRFRATASSASKISRPPKDGPQPPAAGPAGTRRTRRA